MIAKYGKYLKLLIGLIVLALCAELLLNLWHARDPDAIESRQYLAKSALIISRTGGIEGVEFKRKLIYDGTPSDPAYIELTYSLFGVNGKDFLVRLRKYENNQSYQVHGLQEL